MLLQRYKDYKVRVWLRRLIISFALENNKKFELVYALCVFFLNHHNLVFTLNAQKHFV